MIDLNNQSEITNWSELINAITGKEENMFPKLLLKINQFLRPHQKSDPSFNLETVKRNHVDVLENFKLIYEQLLIEDNVIDILVDIPSITTKNSMLFSIMCVGKWIKLHGGGSGRIFFFDEEQTILSDRSIADFLNKIDNVRTNYKYFSKDPDVYYKFRKLPSSEVIDYMKKFNVIAIDLYEKTGPFDYPKIFNDKVLLDQSILITLCSNLSYGLSKSFFKDADNKTPDKTSEILVENRCQLEEFISNKKILVNKSVFEQSEIKLNTTGGVLEKKRFDVLSKKIIIVPGRLVNIVV